TSPSTPTTPSGLSRRTKLRSAQSSRPHLAGRFRPDAYTSTDEIDKPFSAGSLAQVGTSRALERARQPFCPSKARWPRGLLGCGFVNADSRRRRWPQASVYKAASQQRQSAVALGGLPCSKATTAGIAQCPVRDAFGMRCGIVILHGRPRGE